MRKNMWNVFRSALLVSSLLVCAGAQRAGAQTMVKDIYPGTSAEDLGSDPDHFVTIGQTTYFAASTLTEHTQALWKTNGTPAGTVPVKVFRLGLKVSEMITVGSSLYLAVTAWSYGELWRSDGTAGGTFAIASFVGSGLEHLRNLAAFRGAVYFTAWTETHGLELWKSDGTAQGTALFADINSGPGSSDPSRLVPDSFGDAYFSAKQDEEGLELWQLRASGSLARRVIWPGPSGSSPLELTRHGAWVYFSAADGVVGRELFRVNNSTLALVANLAPGPASSGPSELYVAGDNLFFSADDGTAGEELWKITRPGVVQFVRDINQSGSSHPGGFFEVGGEVFFTADDGTRGEELWKSGGTAASTVLFAEFLAGHLGSTPKPIGVVPPSTLLVSTEWPQPGIWAVATGGGQPALLASLTMGSAGAELVAGRLLFAAGPGGQDVEPWISDGTPLGTTQFKELVPPRPESSQPAWLTVLGGEVYFVAHSPGAGRELWKSDGTAAGTVMVADIAAGAASSLPYPGPVAGGQLFFKADDGQNGEELWVTDGSTATLVKNIGPGSLGGLSVPGNTFARSGSRHIVFGADDGQNGAEPWVSDGTPGGTFMLADIHPNGSGFAYPPRPYFARVNGLTYFFAQDAQGVGLWRTDNTQAGTVLVNVPLPMRPGQITASGNTLFFGNYDLSRGGELWSSDGTATGTRQLTSFGGLNDLTPFLGRLLFSKGDGTAGHELWISDGTAAGTRMLADIAPGPQSSYPHILVVADDHVFFSAWEPIGGRELYVTDGSTVSRVADIAAGPESGMFARMAQLGSSTRAIFRALDELWATDGTAAATREIANLAPDPWGSVPCDFTRIGRQIFFTADTPTAGRELWVIDVATAGGLLVEYFGTSSLTSLGQRAVIRRVGWPTIGNAGFETKLRFALPNTPASLLVAAAPGAVPLGGGTCSLYVASPLVALATTTGASGEVRVPLPIPNNPALVGGELFLQYLFVDAGGCFSNLVSLTHGMHVLINR